METFALSTPLSLPTYPNLPRQLISELLQASVSMRGKVQSHWHDADFFTVIQIQLIFTHFAIESF